MSPGWASASALSTVAQASVGAGQSAVDEVNRLQPVPVLLPVGATNSFAAAPVTGGGGTAFDTVTATPVEVVTLPAASRARAVSTWAPSATESEAHVIANGTEVASRPICVPSTRNDTPATPTLSEADAVTLTRPETVAP